MAREFLGGAVNLGASVTEAGTNRVVKTWPVRMDKYVALHLPAGQHVLAVSGLDGQPAIFPLTVADGDEVAVRCEMTIEHMVGHADCASASLPAAFDEIKKTRHNVNAD